MARALWDWDSGRIGPCEAETSRRIGPHETGAAADWAPRSLAPQLFRCFLKGIRGNDNDGRGGESRLLHQAYFAQRDLPNGSRQGGMARFARQKPLSAIRFAQWSHHAWPDSPGEAIERGGVRPARSVERGKICPVGSVEHGRIRPAGSVERGKIRSSCMI